MGGECINWSTQQRLHSVAIESGKINTMFSYITIEMRKHSFALFKLCWNALTLPCKMFQRAMLRKVAMVKWYVASKSYKIQCKWAHRLTISHYLDSNVYHILKCATSPGGNAKREPRSMLNRFWYHQFKWYGYGASRLQNEEKSRIRPKKRSE